MLFPRRARTDSPQNDTPRWYLVAYDIRHPRRLQKVHKQLKKQGGLPLQKSVFAWLGGNNRRDRLIRALEKRIHSEEDDIRLYPIASLEAIDMWGNTGQALLHEDPPAATAWQRLKRWIGTVKRRRQAAEAFQQLPDNEPEPPDTPPDKGTSS